MPEQDYLIIEEGHSHTDWGIENRERQFGPGINSSLEFKIHEIGQLPDGDYGLVLFFMFEYQPPKQLESRSMGFTYRIKFRDLTGSLDKDPLSKKAVEIMSNIYRKKAIKSYEIIKSEFFKRFNDNLIGVIEVTQQDSITQMTTELKKRFGP